MLFVHVNLRPCFASSMQPTSWVRSSEVLRVEGNELCRIRASFLKDS